MLTGARRVCLAPSKQIRGDINKMNWAHIHLMINHLPVVGLLFGFLLLILSTIKKSEELKKISLWCLAVVALTAIPVYLTGEPSEEMVEDLAGVDESMIEQHEDMAFISLIAVILLGAIATGGLFLFRRSATIPGWFIVITLILSVIASGLIGKTANMGGQIRHTEIRKDFQLSISDVKIKEKTEERNKD